MAGLLERASLGVVAQFAVARRILLTPGYLKKLAEALPIG
jgi:hypothetical protein